LGCSEKVNKFMDKAIVSEDIVPISELSKKLGLTSRTLRYWEEMGILESVQKNGGSSRGYTPEAVRRVKFIIKLKDLGLTIREMQKLYAAYGHAKQTERMIPQLLEILDHHVTRVEEKITEMMVLRKELQEYRQRMIEKFQQFSDRDLSAPVGKFKVRCRRNGKEREPKLL